MHCVFCDIIQSRSVASVIAEDELTLAIVDLRQFHPGHVLVIPRRHVTDIREADDDTAAAVFRMTARVARAIDRVFPADGISVWHSAGEGANQEVPHLHVHVHPRFIGDDVLRVYPHAPTTPDRSTLEEYCGRLRQVIEAPATDGR